MTLLSSIYYHLDTTKHASIRYISSAVVKYTFNIKRKNHKYGSKYSSFVSEPLA